MSVSEFTKNPLVGWNFKRHLVKLSDDLSFSPYGIFKVQNFDSQHRFYGNYRKLCKKGVTRRNFKFQKSARIWQSLAILWNLNFSVKNRRGHPPGRNWSVTLSDVQYLDLLRSSNASSKTRFAKIFGCLPSSPPQMQTFCNSTLTPDGVQEFLGSKLFAITTIQNSLTNIDDMVSDNRYQISSVELSKNGIFSLAFCSYTPWLMLPNRSNFICVHALFHRDMILPSKLSSVNAREQCAMNAWQDLHSIKK
jgi:hypothetical protein